MSSDRRSAPPPPSPSTILSPPPLLPPSPQSAHIQRVDMWACTCLHVYVCAYVCLMIIGKKNFKRFIMCTHLSCMGVLSLCAQIGTYLCFSNNKKTPKLDFFVYVLVSLVINLYINVFVHTCLSGCVSRNRR